MASFVSSSARERNSYRYPTDVPARRASAAEKRQGRDGWRRERGNAAVNVSSPINIEYHARFVRRFLAVCISYYVRSPLLLFPHSRASLSPKRTPLILCLEFLYAPQSCIGRSAHNNNNAPQQALVKRALYCCSRCSDAASFLRPDARLLRLAPSLVRAVSACSCPPSTPRHTIP